MASDEYGSRSFLGASKRTSFKMSLHVPGREHGIVHAESADKFGTVLWGTGVAQTEQEILPITAGDKSLHLKPISRIESSFKLARRPVICGDSGSLPSPKADAMNLLQDLEKPSPRL